MGGRSARIAKRLGRSERGQSVVEFAIVLPVLLFIALGAVDVGRVFFDYIGLRAAAMDAALYGARFPDDPAGIRQQVGNHFQPNALPAGTGVTVAVDGTCTGTANALMHTPGFVTVNVTREFRPVSLTALQFLGDGMNWTFTVSPTAKARCLN